MGEETEDMILIEDVNIDDEFGDKQKSSNKKSKVKDDEDDLEVLEVVQVKKPASASKRVESSEEPEEIFVQKARLIQLRKPSSSSVSSTDPSKVTSCVLELLDGKHAGKHINVVSVHMYMWGYNLAKANLN